jgi:ribonuclease P protein component
VVESRHGYPKEERLRSRSEFLQLADRGRKLHTQNFIIVWAERPEGTTRFGPTVSRKVGNAVVRNRVKRFLREYYRLHKELFATADYNIIAKRGAASLTMTGVCQELDRALRRMRA